MLPGYLTGGREYRTMPAVSTPSASTVPSTTGPRAVDPGAVAEQPASWRGVLVFLALAYGLALMAHAYGFLAAFAAGVALRCVESAASGRDEPPPEVDVVLAGDVFYDAVMSERVQPWLLEARRAGAAVLVGDPGRHYLPRSGLTELASYDVPTTRELEGVELKRVKVFALGR